MPRAGKSLFAYPWWLVFDGDESPWESADESAQSKWNEMAGIYHWQYDCGARGEMEQQLSLWNYNQAAPQSGCGCALPRCLADSDAKRNKNKIKNKRGEKYEFPSNTPLP
jgi:hypothetical protein